MKDPNFNTSKNELTYLLEDGIRSKVTLQTLESEGQRNPFLNLTCSLLLPGWPFKDL